MGSNIAYCASKAAVGNLTKSLARALAPDIRVVSVSPGLVDTEFVNGLDEDWRNRQAELTPLGRLSRPEEVAGARRGLGRTPPHDPRGAGCADRAGRACGHMQSGIVEAACQPIAMKGPRVDDIGREPRPLPRVAIDEVLLEHPERDILALARKGNDWVDIGLEPDVAPCGMLRTQGVACRQVRTTTCQERWHSPE